MVFSADKGGVKPANKRAFYAAIAIDAGSLILFKVLSGLSYDEGRAPARLQFLSL